MLTCYFILFFEQQQLLEATKRVIMKGSREILAQDVLVVLHKHHCGVARAQDRNAYFETVAQKKISVGLDDE